MIKRYLIMVSLAAGMLVNAQAGDFTISQDVTKPTNSSAFVVKHTLTGAIIACWYKGNTYQWVFHDPSNKISVQVNASGVVTGWTLN